jgi:hypothetical protein
MDSVCTDLFHKYPDKRWQLVCIPGWVYVPASLLKWWVEKSTTGKRELLRSGTPCAAVVEEVSSVANAFNGSHNLTFWYRNMHGTLTRKHNQISKQICRRA